MLRLDESFEKSAYNFQVAAMNGRKSTDDTKRLFTQLLLTCKNVSLYPEGHSISANSIRQFHDALTHYIRQYGDLKIEVERESVVCQGVEVHKGSLEEGTLPFTLFRDGIRWLEFTEGVTLDELREFLSLIGKYSTLTQEPEGDIVTAFWEAHFDHILYEADEFVTEQALEQSESFDEQDLSRPEEKEETQETEISSEASADSLSSEASAINPDDFLLTPEEKTLLQEMITREELMPSTEHLSMLMDLLLQLHQEKDFHIVLGVLSEEFDYYYGRRDFESTLAILDGIRLILKGGHLKSPPAPVEAFYKKITSVAVLLKPLEEILSNLNSDQIEKLGRIFDHLRPESAETLVKFLLLGQPSQLEKIIEDRVIALVRQDPSCLDASVNQADEKIAEKLIPILSSLGGDVSFRHLMKLTRHGSSAVRRMAVRTIGQVHGEKFASLFSLIDDPDEAVRRLVLEQMGQTRNEAAEIFLLAYLEKQESSSKPGEHIRETFRTLGKCGSSRSIPFLRQTLFYRKWLAGLKKSPYREGAAIALVHLDTPEAAAVLRKAGKSLHPGLRKIARGAMQEQAGPSKGAR